MIEGRNNNAVHHIEFSEHVIDFLLNTRILKDTGFQLNIRDNIRILHQLQILSQCRHFLWSMLPSLFIALRTIYSEFGQVMTI